MSKNSNSPISVVLQCQNLDQRCLSTEFFEACFRAHYRRARYVATKDSEVIGLAEVPAG